jgi:hypothetical protein
VIRKIYLTVYIFHRNNYQSRLKKTDEPSSKLRPHIYSSLCQYILYFSPEELSETFEKDRTSLAQN